MSSSRIKNVSSQAIIHVTASAGAQLENNLSPIALKSSGENAQIDVYRSCQINMGATAGSDRLPFEHDRDRIFHCRQFRKLAGKTQLLIAPTRGDIRTRLTHTMEVYQLSTSIARRLNLNIPAVEAIALGHDIGHTPFGHAGEAALNEILLGLGGFHHAVHSVRSLDRVAYDQHTYQTEHTCGLNLTSAVREGILKHGWFEGPFTPYHLPPLSTKEWDLAGPQTRLYGSAEAQVVKLADGIAYLNHDIDDLLLYGFEKIISKRIVGEFFERHKVSSDKSDEYENWKKAKQNFLNLLTYDGATRVKSLIRDAINASVNNINRVLSAELDWKSEKIIDFSPIIHDARTLFYHFFNECVYSDIRIKHKNEIAKECLCFLHGFFSKFFMGNPDLLPLHIQDELKLSTPWWYNYLCKLHDAKDSKKTNKEVDNIPDKLTIACALAATDIVADLTDQEALASARALREAESTSGMEVLDRILATFPNTSQIDLNLQRQSAYRQELSGLLSVAGD